MKARTRSALFLILLSLTALIPLSRAQEIELRPAVELTERAGLPNFFAKLKSGEDVKVGYLGGSITDAPGWRVKSLSWLQDRYPDTALSEINAAIGGTGSDLGVYRAGQDVIQHKPDLLFVEFAVNDTRARVRRTACAGRRRMGGWCGAWTTVRSVSWRGLDG